MNYLIVSDSSSNLFQKEGVPYCSVPMKIIAGEKEYTDTPQLDLAGMVEDLKKFKGRSGSSCPNVQDWLDVFGDADRIFAVTISKNLSGSFNSAREAAAQYMEKHPDRKVCVLDTMSAGPEQAMLIDRLAQLMEEGLDFEAIRDQALEYNSRTHILFCLESLTNLARNGRVSPAVAAIAGVLNIRIVGNAQNGQIVPVHKPRGQKKAMQALVDMLVERGLREGCLVRVAHCFGEAQAQAFKEAVEARVPGCRFIIEPTTALCSFYAEAGGLMIGFEGNYNTENHNQDFE
jgi:DegV family protein with EDD domain